MVEERELKDTNVPHTHNKAIMSAEKKQNRLKAHSA